MMLHEFLGYTYQSGVPITDGDPIGSPAGLNSSSNTSNAQGFPKTRPGITPTASGG